MAVIQRSFSPVKEWSWRSNSRQQVHPLTQIFLLLFRPSSTSEFRQKGEPNATKTDTPHPQDKQDGIKRPREIRGEKTNDDTISLEDAACGYKGLMVIERRFRSLKRTRIKTCPMFHWVPRWIDAHGKICVLSLLIERVAELKCGQPWTRIQRGLEELQISHFLTNGYSFFAGTRFQQRPVIY